MYKRRRDEVKCLARIIHHQDTKAQRRAIAKVKNAIASVVVRDNMSKLRNANVFRKVRSLLDLVSLCLGGDE